ncbi:MAG: ATP/GTP-binding protein, partial [Candidatus Thermoplasmatota archaeon]|nr:ATP/GTP-binding protein [Candidatus Thermoplasmatota archaeon]
MDHTALLYFVGPAGAGKSTLVATLQEWMQHYRYDGVAINLDPGSETVAYEAAIDVREKFTVSQIMDEYSLGPNGAQVVCADLLAVELDWIKEQVDEINCDYFLVDTPGQTELFLYREASKVLVENISPRAGIVLLLDPLLSRTPEGFVTQLLLASAAHLRFPIPM